MPNYEFVSGDEYHQERKRHFLEANRLQLWAGSILLVSTIGSFVVYGFAGGRGWLAVGLLSGFIWLVEHTSDCFRRSAYVSGQIDHRLRIIEAEVNATLIIETERSRREAERRSSEF